MAIKHYTIASTLKHLFVTIFVLFSACAVPAAPVNELQVRQMVAGWLATDYAPLEATLGCEVGEIIKFGGLGYAVHLKPSGLVIVPADDRIEPIIAFSPQSEFDPSLDHPFSILVVDDLEARMRFINSANAMKASSTAKRAQDKWLELAAARKILKNRANGVSDLRVPSLVKSAWDQESEGGAYDYCYNYFTPNHYPCGCAATAMAQLMRYHRYSSAAVGPRQFEVTVEHDPNPYQTFTMLGGDGAGGPYNWDIMPLDPDQNTSAAERRAIGALCFDAGISVGTRYGPLGSSADMYSVMRSLKNVFYYANIIYGWNQGGSILAGFDGMANANLDAGYPVLLAIEGSGGGHAIVCDGYGYNNGTLYHHLNMGWGTYNASDNVWYALPNIDASLDFNSVRVCLYNIFPVGGGEIISGRVSDGLGNPISGAIVTAYRQGGGQYQAISNRRGIYALVGLPSSSTYTLSVSKGGFSFSTRTVSTGSSTYYSAYSGNQAGIDFTGTGSHAAEPVAYPVMGDYDGNNLADIGIYRDDAATWNIKINGTANAISFGVEGCQPLLADFDGDAKADPALYSDSLSLWAFKLSGSGYAMTLYSFGNPGSHPAAADFDGDAKADPALYQESSCTWLALLSKSGYALNSVVAGSPNCRPVAGDFDGDRYGDPAVFQYTSCTWSVMLSGQGYRPTIFRFGTLGDQPAAGDYDGDGKADPAVYSYSSGQWTILQSARNYSPVIVNFFGE